MGKMMFGAGLAIVASMAAASPALAATSLVTNGNFENGLAGWSAGGFGDATDIAAIKGSAYIANAGASGSAAAAANTFAAFGAGNVDNGSTLISYAFNTVAGTTYKLTFDYAQFGGAAYSEVLKYGLFGTGFTGFQGANGAKTGTEAQVGGTNLDTIFQTHTLYFTGTGNALNLRFSLGSSATNGTDGLLDNVAITAVPEASTWAMFILGFGALGVSYRRRKQVVSFA